MRKLLPVFLFCVIAFSSYAQTPQAIKYQAVARDAAGNVIANSDIAFRITIIENSENGPGVYVETHNLTSNEFGLISMEVGRGNAVTGTMQDVDWANARHFLRVEMDPSGGQNYEIMGVSELLSVPYAFHARTAENVDDADADSTNELITRLELIGAGLEIEEGGVVHTVNLASLINDADADPTNELITQLNFRNDSIIITEGGIERGVEIQGFFSGDYGDLTGLPNFQDSINLYGFDGDYNNLSNVPNFADSVNAYGFDGNYGSLTGVPNFADSVNAYGFDGNYNNLSNVPNFADSVNAYGFDGDYNNLVNRPDIADSINALGFDGDYNSLSNRPDFQDSINLYGFDGNYGSLTGVPNFADSVNAYAFDGDYNNLVNRPDIADSINALGFDGDYNSLSNRPDFQDSINLYGFDGNYGSLTGVPNFADTVNAYGFDGDYNNLVNRPDIADSINALGFDGDYNSLSNRPDFQDSINLYGFDGNYGSLTGVPNFADTVNAYGFDGNYNNLSNVPNFADSVNAYAFDGDYNNLVNRPDIADSINALGFDGDYNSLSNRPDFQDSINLYGFDGNYGSLTGVPNFADTVNAYGFDGNYNNLSNVPNFADSVNAYAFDGDYNNLVNRPDIADSINALGFDGDYNSLSNRPDFQDSINLYGFDGNYGSLTGVPNFADTVNAYGFDGNYNNLSNVPNFADTVNAYGRISSATFNNDSLFITEAGTTFDVDLSGLSGQPQDLTLSDDTLRITDNPTSTPILLSDYRSKWNEKTPGGDLFTNRNVGFGVSNPLYRLHLYDTLTGSDTALVKLSSYNNSTSNPNEKATLLIENIGVSNRNHNGVFIRAVGTGSARNAGLRLISDNATRNYGGILRTGMDNTSGSSAVDNIGYMIDAGNATTFNLGVQSSIREATGAFNVAQWGVVRDNSVPSAISFSVGGYMQSTAANDEINRGVWAIARNAANENYGIYATVDNSTNGTNYAVYGDATGATNAFAGFFEGDVEITGDLNVTGNIAKGGGTFRIDHPLDPTNKYLVHSFVESPDMMNVYNGNITTDANGFATVELPEYFSEVNKDFRYQLTVVGTFAQAIVKEKISGNRFVIQTDQPNVEVSWQITGIRNDPYARENRINPEQEKPQGKKGKYLHPDVYGVDNQKDRSKFKDLPSSR